jgi:uncharacterized membrane protein (DUF4010 family)
MFFSALKTETSVPPPSLVVQFGIALFIGALIGIERERKQADEKELTIGGLRTFTLIALCGAVAAWLSQTADLPWLFLAVGAMVTAAILAGYVLHVRAQPKSVGMTTEIAALVTYLLGGTTLYGEAGVAVALAIATSAVLAFKQPMHGFVHRIGQDDLYAALKLLIATFIILPVLPNRTLDPWEALNPYELWVLVIAISGLSLFGYVLSRWIGATKGTTLTGLLGGLVSSTAVTLSLARRSRESAGDSSANRAADPALLSGLMLAWCMMFIRVIVEVAIVHPPLVPRIALGMGTMAAAAVVVAAINYRRANAAASAVDVPLKNPFSLTAAIKFAALFSVVLCLVALVKRNASSSGVYAVAALAGLADVDAITLSMARSAKDSGESDVAVHAITVATVTNTLVKCAIFAVLGAPRLRWKTAAATAAILAAGAASIWLY